MPPRSLLKVNGMKWLILFSVLVVAMFALTTARAKEYEMVAPAPCDTNPDQAFPMGLEFMKGSVRALAAQCNEESVAEVVVANHHTIVVDPSAPDEICGLVSFGVTPACAWFIKKVLAGNSLAPIQESAHVVRIVPLSSVKPGRPLADMSW